MGTLDRGRFGALAAGLGLMLAVTACSSGSSKVLVRGPQSPPIPTSATSASAATSPTVSTPASGKKHHATATTAASATTTAGSAPRTTTTPKPATSKSATRTSACTTNGPTTTIKMVAPYRFSPSSVTINRCDAVKAVYADSTGTPHNWMGHGWSSPDMTSSGQSYTYRFTSTGTFNFFCSYHQSVGMTGTVTVH